MTPRQRLVFGVLIATIMLGQMSSWFIGRQRIVEYLTLEVAVAQASASTEAGAVSSDDAAIALEDDRPCSADALCDRVHVNWATHEQLQALPGIGPVLANNIIAAREEKLFGTMQDLLRVTGIGPKRLEQIKDLICLEIYHVTP